LNKHYTSDINPKDLAIMRGEATTRIVITCPKRIPPIARREAEQLGFTVEEETTAGVITRGTLHDALRLNLHIRTGHRVLLQLRKFFVRTPQDLHKSLSTIAWEHIIPANGYFSVVSSVETETITNSMFANQKCKDAIVDRIRAKHGTRPDSGSEKTGAVVYLYWKGSECVVYLDTSGESLSKRGYRALPWQAPMRETLAAATLLASKWDAASTFINPMCGSGTLAIEAAWIALNRAPGLLRENYAFMHLAGYEEHVKESWNSLCAKARAKERTELPFPIIATDISTKAIEAAEYNAEAAQVAAFIRFAKCDFKETPVPPVNTHLYGAKPCIMLNPPYGERLGEAATIEEDYKHIGDFLKQHGRGYTGYVFTGNLEAAKRIGLKASRRTEFFNSDIDCRLLEYELYEGTRRTPASERTRHHITEQTLPAQAE
jgi:putative N6-adenine-specific DNA methylase